MTISGKALSESTKQWLESKTLPYQPLGATGLHVSQVGFGGYRVDAQETDHYDALTKALQLGVNVVDTSANYADGRSEELVGVVLEDLTTSGEIKRENVVVVTKGGYLQGQNYDMSQLRKNEGRPFADLVPYSDGLEHCIHPGFLEDQITRSLERLKLETIDVYLLHNPEYFLDWAAKNDWSPADAKAEYHRRIDMAFRHLESEVEKGRIGCYGISSNTFGYEADDPTHTSLSGIIQVAEAITKDHNFHVIQAPCNLLEPGILINTNQPNDQSVVDIAEEKKLGVLANRPLNALRGEAMLRLIDVQVDSTVSEGEVIAAIKDLMESEKDLVDTVIQQGGYTDDIADQLKDLFSIGEGLEKTWKKFGSLDQWRWAQENFFMRRVQTGSRFVMQQEEQMAVGMASRLENYVMQCSKVLDTVDTNYRMKMSDTGKSIRQALKTANAEWEAPTLSHGAIRALRTTKGIDCILVGMRHTTYVDDVLDEANVILDQKDRKSAWDTLHKALNPS